MKVFRSPIFSKTNIVIVIILIACIVNSCKRESKSASPLPNDVTQAKSWYESSYPSAASSGGSLVTQSVDNNHDLASGSSRTGNTPVVT